MSNPFSTPDPGIAQQERDLERIGKGTETVYAHVERTVHRLLEEIDREATARASSCDWAFRVKLLAEAVHALCAVAYPTSEGGPR